MRLSELISKLDSDIITHQKLITQLEEKRKKLSSIQDSMPNAIYHNGAICIPNIWDKISCMKIERKQRFSLGQTEIVVKFSTGKKYNVDNKKIYSHPFENTVATVLWHPTGPKDAITWKNEIIINDIDVLIDKNCPKRKDFINRIKLFLIDEIHRYDLAIDDTLYKN